MNHIQQKVKLAEQPLESKILVKSNQQGKNATGNRYLTAIILALLAVWILLSIANNGLFMTEAITSSFIIAGLLFMRTYYDPESLKKEA